MNKQNENTTKKSSYDARKPFSELLVRLIHEVTQASGEGDIYNWRMKLLHYYTMTSHFIGSEENSKIEEYIIQLQELENKCKEDNIKRDHKQNKVLDSVRANNMFSHFAPPILLSLQKTLFSATNQLLLPSADTEDDNDFNASKIFGGD